jgi:hypothetical protein
VAISDPFHRPGAQGGIIHTDPLFDEVFRGSKWGDKTICLQSAVGILEHFHEKVDPEESADEHDLLYSDFSLLYQ